MESTYIYDLINFDKEPSIMIFNFSDLLAVIGISIAAIAFFSKEGVLRRQIYLHRSRLECLQNWDSNRPFLFLKFPLTVFLSFAIPVYLTFKLWAYTDTDFAESVQNSNIFLDDPYLSVLQDFAVEFVSLIMSALIFLVAMIYEPVDFYFFSRKKSRYEWVIIIIVCAIPPWLQIALPMMIHITLLIIIYLYLYPVLFLVWAFLEYLEDSEKEVTVTLGLAISIVAFLL